MSAPPVLTGPMDPDSVRLVDCAGCRVVMLGVSMRLARDHGLLPSGYTLMPMMAARFRGRPYCAGCVGRKGLRVKVPVDAEPGT